jgi:hypothetical protein
MKKFLAVTLAAVTTLAMLTSCSSGGSSSSSAYTTGLGIVTSISSSKAGTADAGPTAQVDSTIAAVSFDAGGKITKCSLDVAQTQVAFNTDGSIASDVTAAIQSKQEKQGAYGMASASSIGKEWYQQADAFADYCIGKTVDQVKGVKVTENPDEPGSSVPDVPELTSSVTISVSSFIQAIDKAHTNAR